MTPFQVVQKPLFGLRSPACGGVCPKCHRIVMARTVEPRGHSQGLSSLRQKCRKRTRSAAATPLECGQAPREVASAKCFWSIVTMCSAAQVCLLCTTSRTLRLLSFVAGQNRACPAVKIAVFKWTPFLVETRCSHQGALSRKKFHGVRACAFLPRHAPAQILE